MAWLLLAEWLWILLSIALVVSGEIFNSCIEKTIDYISLKRDPRAALIKDLAAAGVSVLCLFAALTAASYLYPRFWRCLHHDSQVRLYSHHRPAECREIHIAERTAGTKEAISSNKPNTTRNNIAGI
ncbi:diacylglycerol kinase [Faecalibaculum rodentium]|uniref:diacylglycerol kinase n=1 Tax=Faecalibaculum rodentium TaxID=1702221 RepID=UPI003F672DD4